MVVAPPTASWFRARRHYQQQRPRSVRQTLTAAADHGSRVAALRPGTAPGLQASKAHAATTRRRECSAGVEPASPGWKPGTFAARPGAPRCFSCGGRNRTCVRTVNSRLPVPARTPPHRSVRMVGLEPTLSCSRRTRDPQLPHILILQSAQRESNPHVRHGKATGCRYIMGAAS